MPSLKSLLHNLDLKIGTQWQNIFQEDQVNDMTVLLFSEQLCFCVNRFFVIAGKSCRLRWFNQLDPRINRKGFSEEEEERLLNAHKVYGNKWAMISRLFPGRTDNAVKNHWHVIMARMQREKSCVYRRRKPTFQIHPSKNLDLILPLNRGSESTISSTTIDESASTGTNLSFTPSSAKPTPLPLHNHCPVQNLQAFSALMGMMCFSI